MKNSNFINFNTRFSHFFGYDFDFSLNNVLYNIQDIINYIYYRGIIILQDP